MTRTISDLTVSVERTVDVDADAVFDAIANLGQFDGVERVVRASEQPTVATGPPPGSEPGATYVGAVSVPETAGANATAASTPGGVTFDTYFTVDERGSRQLVLDGGGDADVGSFDAHVVVAVADVPEGAIVRVDATMDVAGDVATAGAEAVRVAAAGVLERYLSIVDRDVPRPS
jgi:carbon monoxide dehydrogenase subunit G